MVESTDSLPEKDDFGFDGPFPAGSMLDCLDLEINKAVPDEKDDFGFDGPFPDRDLLELDAVLADVNHTGTRL